MGGDDGEVRRTFDRVRNWGRWGTADVRGTANLVDEAARLAAVATVRSGRVYALGRVVDPSALTSVTVVDVTDPAVADVTRQDELQIRPHGFHTTHLDALDHCFFDGWAWNGRRRDDVRASSPADAAAVAEGIVTRGVLLDVAAARDVDFLADTHPISGEDLGAAERRAGVAVRRGDAVLVRSGRAVAEARGRCRPDRRAGMALSALEWLHERDVAVYAGDCVDLLPSPYPGYPDYFHQVALAGMGLVLLDLPDLEELRRAVQREASHEFLLVVSGPRVVGATGVAVNPLACF